MVNFNPNSASLQTGAYQAPTSSVYAPVQVRMTGAMPYFMQQQQQVPTQQSSPPPFDISSLIQMLMPMLMQLFAMLRQPATPTAPPPPPPIAVGLPALPEPEPVPPDDPELVPPDDPELLPPDEPEPPAPAPVPAPTPVPTPAPAPGPNPNDGDGLEIDIDDAADHVNLRRWTRNSNSSSSIGDGSWTMQEIDDTIARTDLPDDPAYGSYGTTVRGLFTKLKNNFTTLDINHNNAIDLYELTWLAQRGEDPNFLENADFVGLDGATPPPAAPSSLFAYFSPVTLGDTAGNISFNGTSNSTTTLGKSTLSLQEVKDKRVLFRSRTQPNEFNPAFSDYFNEPLKGLYASLDLMFFNVVQKFSAIDRNSDGKIDTNEFATLAARSGNTNQIEMSDFSNLA